MKIVKSTGYRRNIPLGAYLFGPLACRKIRQTLTKPCLKFIFFCAWPSFLTFGLDSRSLPENQNVFIVEKNDLEKKELQREVPPHSHWVESLFTDENDVTLKSIRNQIQTWEDTEEYNKNWNLESTGLFPETETDSKISFIKKNALKYLDKRISKAAEKAEPQSGLQKVGTVQKALRPSTQVELTQGVKLKFKAQVLQGKATVLLNNPFFNWITELNAQGKVEVSLIKDLVDLGIKTKINYNSKKNLWEAAIDKQLGRSVSSTLSSSQSPHDMAFTNESDRKLEVNFVQPF